MGWVALDLCDGLSWVEFFWPIIVGWVKKSPQPDPCTPLTKIIVHVHMSILVNPSTHVFFPPSPSTLIPNFLPILGKKLFGRPHISFPSPPPNQTFSKKNFFPIFFFSTRPTIHSTKHIFNVELFATKYSNCFGFWD